ncbi:MAG: glutathione peroxidase [Sphingomonadaceae bacterium]|nr:glutathione peroxidase [Sphingomonadaceae bacterium]
MNKLAYIALGVIVLGALGYVAAAQFPKARINPMPAEEASRHSAWDFDLTAIDGTPLPMARFKGDVVLLVNTASFCGFTPQYDGLEKLQDSYAPKGFTVIGVPSGDFLGQEYGSNHEISQFCRTKFGIKFPLAEKADVVGANTIPIYRWAAAVLGRGNAPKWNFHKYLIGRDGKLITAFGTKVTPNDPSVTKAIEAALAAKA